MSKPRVAVIKVRPEVIAMKKLELKITTNKQFAEFLGVTTSTASRIETGSQVSPKMVGLLCEKLNLVPNQLVKITVRDDEHKAS